MNPACAFLTRDVSLWLSGVLRASEQPLARGTTLVLSPLSIYGRVRARPVKTICETICETACQTACETTFPLR